MRPSFHQLAALRYDGIARSCLCPLCACWYGRLLLRHIGATDGGAAERSYHSEELSKRWFLVAALGIFCLAAFLTAELALMKGEMVAVEQTSKANKCGIQFWGRPPGEIGGRKINLALLGWETIVERCPRWDTLQLGQRPHVPA
jgi:hypothetical protein